MSRLVILLFAFLSVTACNNNKKTNTQQDKSGQPGDQAGTEEGPGDKDRVNTSQFTWTKKEQNKFLEDCKKEPHEEEEDSEKLNDRCSCLLAQAQKYYPSYRQMDEKSNDDHDREIFAACHEKYGPVED